MASSLEQFYKGLQFSVYGVVLETMSFNGTDGSTQRLVRIGCAGKTFSVFVDTDEELRKFDSLTGSMVRCIGRVLRAKNSAAEVVKELLLLQDVEPSAELLSRMETLPTRIRSSLERFGNEKPDCVRPAFRLDQLTFELYDGFSSFGL